MAGITRVRAALLPVSLYAPPLVQVPAQHRVAGSERAGFLVAAQTAHVHFHLGVQIVGMMDDQALGQQGQARRAPMNKFVSRFQPRIWQRQAKR